jgi:hypothetical protein
MTLELEGVDYNRRAAVVLDHITVARRDWQREQRRPKSLTAREALAALRFEALMIWTAAHNVANGVELSEDDLARLTTSCSWIDAICEEAL